ncbi:MAG: hypothetical protein ABSB15_05645 [Bryobacteraceae bacterium]|jgi:uroporphyrinogen-III synthase
MSARFRQNRPPRAAEFVASIGPTTTEALEDYGIKVGREAASPPTVILKGPKIS